MPLTIALGFAHQIGVARLAWRLQLAHDFQDGQTTFISGDLVSVERVFNLDGIRPYGRVGLAIGMDIQSPEGSFGQRGFFLLMLQ